MPSGQTHSAATVALATGLGVYAVMTSQPLALAAGCLAGLILTPDLDVAGGSISNHHVSRVGGCLLGGIWRVYWWPYSRLIPHRSPLSHFPILGTASRLLWLFIGPILGLLLSGLAMPEFPVWAIWAIAGLAASDTLHWVMDQLFRN